MKKDLISIIIPVYNCERYFEDCLDSIIDQTYKNIEIIIINDGSTDSTQDIIDKYVKQHKFIFGHYQKNSGQGVARNKALKLAKGEYVAFVDSDDMLHPKFLESLYNSIIKNNSDFAICDWMYYLGPNNTRYVNKSKFIAYELLENENKDLILDEKIYFTVNKLYKKDFLVKNNIKYGEGYIYEDFEHYIKTCILANKISTVPNPYYLVRINDQSTTKTNYDNMLHYDSFLNAIEISLKEIKYDNKYSKFYVYKYFLDRAYVYYKNRMPSKKIGKKFLKAVFKILNEYKENIEVPQTTRKKYRIIIKDILPKNRVRVFVFLNNFVKNKMVKKTNKKIGVVFNSGNI